MMARRIQVTKHANESTASLIRRFSKKVQGSGIVKYSKKIRYYSRPASEFAAKKRALKRIERGKEYERLRKLGKIGYGVRRKGR